MGRQLISDERIAKEVQKRAPIPKRTWEDFYFDLIGAGEMTGAMKGIAQISKPEAVKQLTKGFRNVIESSAKKGFSEITPERARVLRVLTKTVRKLPQEFLDPVKSINLERQIPKVFGTYKPVEKDIYLSMESLATRTATDPRKAANTLIHEIGHSKQWEEGLSYSLSNTPREIHMQYFADELEQVLKEEKGLTLDTLNEIYGNTLAKAVRTSDYGIPLKDVISETATQRFERASIGKLDKIVKELGGELLTPENARFGKTLTKGIDYERMINTSDDILQQAMTTKSLSKDAFQLGRDIHAGNVSPAMVKEAHGELMKRIADPMERATRGQFMTEALEFADILGGKTAGKEGKVEFLKKLGELPKEFGKSTWKNIRDLTLQSSHPIDKEIAERIANKESVALGRGFTKEVPAVYDALKKMGAKGKTIGEMTESVASKYPAYDLRVESVSAPNLEDFWASLLF